MMKSCVALMLVSAAAFAPARVSRVQSKLGYAVTLIEDGGETVRLKPHEEHLGTTSSHSSSCALVLFL